MPGGMSMSDDDMRATLSRYFAAHPAHGTSTAAAPVDSFLAVNFRFEEDGNSATQVDTAHITVGNAIRFKWGTGFHTVTSGEGSSDPNSGAMFNNELTSSAENFDFQYNSPGTFPFYCVVHETSNMKGVVVVSAPVGIATEPPPRIGFISRLTPNPTSGGVTSAINLPRAGRARLEVFDAQGRRIATPLDTELSMGIHGVVWDGRRSDGTRVRTGIYLMRLTVPGLRETRTVTIER
jgi:plastocyanin